MDACNQPDTDPESEDNLVLKATDMVINMLTSGAVDTAPMRTIITKNIETILKQACTLQQTSFEGITSITAE